MKYILFWFWELYSKPNSGSQEFDSLKTCEEAKKAFYENVTAATGKVAYCTKK